MNESNSEVETAQPLNKGNLVCSGLFILIGIICFYETTKMSDPDSFVFPRMVIAGLIGLSIVNIVLSIFKPSETVNNEGATQYDSPPSTPRRLMLVAAMAGSAVMMSYIGFALSGIITFIILMLLSQYEEWTNTSRWLFPLIAVLIVFGFFWSFSTLLHVPLPEGSWINFP